MTLLGKGIKNQVPGPGPAAREGQEPSTAVASGAHPQGLKKFLGLKVCESCYQPPAVGQAVPRKPALGPGLTGTW